MKRAGLVQYFDIKDTALTGIFEGVYKLKNLKDAYYRIKREIYQKKFSAIILIDFPDFNIKISKITKKFDNKIPIFYYIPPQVWAWRQKRAGQIAKLTDIIFTVLPFEKGIFKRYGGNEIYIGNPVYYRIKRYKDENSDWNLKRDKNLIALFPGSRINEVRISIPVFLKAARLLKKKHSGFKFILSVANSIDRIKIEKLLKDTPMYVEISDESSFNIFKRAGLAIVNSGTATLECALFKTPMIVVYKLNPLTYYIVKNMVNIDYISLVNNLLNKKVVPELIQRDFTPENILREVEEIMDNDKRYFEVCSNFDEIDNILGSDLEYPPAEIAARNIFDYIKR